MAAINHRDSERRLFVFLRGRALDYRSAIPPPVDGNWLGVMPDTIEKSGPAETESRWFSRPGAWFWLLIALGAALRIYLVVFTQGPYDAGLWQLHAMGITRLGFID